ncbi:helix-turn-helix domain-containing protein [Desulfurococcus mucosus]|uniref:Transcriptional regulator TrmB n=1 Tax=Desulfurococcus mucosus (strain ATCC 35584 / DSM 2162 / JCM 9187 / O7/1) TaxID=765177 RepID=E8R905_DESM0|nr:helix-turn-helix domain-containing protein [Desulfurococcus mucosus]ADV64981.1 transcriptional regulator TrmB [Desulfurococcus mucosus DSM 2162]
MSSDLSETELRIYVYLVEKRRPMGLREIAREVNLPVSTVHYNLRKLVEKGYVVKNLEGYVAKGSLNIEGFIRVGYRVIPRLILYSLLYLGMSIGGAISMYIQGYSSERLMLIAVSLSSSLLMLHEGLTLRRRLMHRG